MRRVGFLLTVLLALLVLAGCGEEPPANGGQDQQQDGEQTAAEEAPAGEDGGTTTDTGEMTTDTGQGDGAQDGAPGEVTVGGFVVEGGDVPETTVPQVSVNQADAEEYLEQIQPVADNTIRDVSDLVQPEVSLEDGDLSLSVEVSSLEAALGSVEDGVGRLEGLETPEELEPVNQELIRAYEEVQPAYEEIIAAAETDDLERLGSAVEENLPRIERFNSEVQTVVRDLERATGN